VRTLVIPDIHVPFHHRRSIAKLQDFIKRKKPERIVFLGDVLDLHAVSTHRRDPRWEDNLDKEIRAGRRLLEQIRKLAPKADIDYIEGNHEDRWNRYCQGRTPALRLLGFTWDAALGLADLGISVRRKPFSIPCGQGKKVVLLHGHEVKGHSKFPAGHALNIAKKMGKNVHIGHTHRMGLVSSVFSGRELFAVEGGYLGDFNSPGFKYMGAVPPEWTRGWQLYDSDNRDNPFPHMYRV